MSGIGEVAYTVLLGWMRALVDWFWSLFSGTGNTGIWSWFISNWKIWLIVLLIGGLVVDWLIWVVRWRPYRLLFGKARKAPAGGPDVDETWDSGVGYYEMETPADVAPDDWANTTFATLSEIDPDWAGGVAIADDEEPLYDPDYAPNQHGYYTETYEEPVSAEGYQDPAAEQSGYWEEEDDEQADFHVVYDEVPYQEPAPIENDTPEVTFFGYQRPQRSEPVVYEEHAYEEPVYEEEVAYEEEPADAPDGPPPGFDPFAPYDAYDPADVAAYETDQPEEPPRRRGQHAAAMEDTGPQLYGRPGLWPGQVYGMPIPQQEPEPEEPATSDTPLYVADEAYVDMNDEPYDPLFNPDAPIPDAPRHRRRRRRIRESTSDLFRAPIEEDTAEPVDSIYAQPPMPSWIEQEESSPEEAESFADIHPDIVAEPPPKRDLFSRFRPERVVTPNAADKTGDEAPAEKAPRWKIGKQPAKDKDSIRTVTGRPATRRGLLRLSGSEDEPISGLPPMHLTDPFLPVVRPDDPDFAPDDGEEYD